MGELRGKASSTLPGGVASVLLLALLTGCGKPESPGSTRLESQLFERVQIIGKRGAGVGEFNKPRSVAVDGDDNIFVVDITGRVQKFSPTGEHLLGWLMPQTDRGKAKGMCTAPDGGVLLVEPHYFRVNHFAPDGKLVHQWGEEGREVGKLIFPRAVAVAPDGAMWVSEYSFAERIQKFAPDGSRVLLAIGEPGPGPSQFNRVEGLGMDPEGNVYAADSVNHRIQVFSADGTFLRQYGHAGTKPGEMSYPYDIRLDAAGRQYVCEFGNSRLQVFDREDKLVEIIGGVGAAPGMFNNPWAITLDSQGNLIVADSLNHRVQKFWRRKSVTNRGEDDQKPVGGNPGNTEARRETGNTREFQEFARIGEIRVKLGSGDCASIAAVVSAARLTVGSDANLDTLLASCGPADRQDACPTLL